MTVQIFIPTYNRASKLKAAITSCQNQTFSNIEIVVLDNHSSDNTPEAIAKLMVEDKRIHYIRHKTNIGMWANFNSIRELVSADYFTVLTDDDTYEPWYIDTAINIFKSNNGISFVACNAPTKHHDAIVNSQLDKWQEGPYQANSNQAMYHCLKGKYPLMTNCLYKSIVANDFVFHYETGNTSDGLLFVCLFAKYDSYVSKTITGYWNNDGTNASSTQKYHPIEHINTVIYHAVLYDKFCKKNNLKKRFFISTELKKLVAVLVAADHSSFNLIYKESLLSDYYNPLIIVLLRLAHILHILPLGLAIKASLR